MGNCKGKLSKSEKTKLGEDAYVKNRDKIDHGRDGPTVHSKADIDENEERSAHAKISTIPVNAIDHGKDGPAVHKKTDVDENEESSTHTKISTKPVIAIDHGKDGQTVHKKTDVDENEEKNKMSTESNIIEHANDGPTINQLPIVSNNSDPSTTAFESKNQHENNVPEIKDTNFKTENSGDSLICTKENSRPSKKDTNVTGNETHVTIEPTNGINRVQKEMKKKNQDPIAQQTERQMYNFASGHTADSDIKEEDTPVVTPDLNVNTVDIHCTDIDLNQNFGDKHGTGLSQNAGEKNGTDLSQNTGDKHGTDLSQNAGEKNTTDLSQNAGDKHGTGLNQNTGDKCGTDLSRNTGEKNAPDSSQNTGDKRSTDANKMPKVPDVNTSNKTLKGGEVTQNKDQNTPADKTADDDNEDTTGYDSAKYAKRIDDKDKNSETKSTKKGKKKKKIKNRTDFNLGDINTSVMNIGCDLGNVITTIHNPPETRKTEVVNIACRAGDIKTEIIHQPPASPGEEATPLLDMKKIKALAEVSSSIGMFEGKYQGSCWRAGTDLIVTAWHVVHDHIWEYGFLNEIKLKEVKIKFDYTGSGDCDESNIFEIEPKVLYHNETLDTAILRLKPNGKVVTFPPPFRRLDHFLIPAKDEDQTIYLIGHPDGSPLRVNLDVGLWNPTDERMQSLQTFCRDKGYENGYTELDKSERLVVKCQFEHGASGCPGVVVLDDNQLYLVTMFLRGFPDFYFSKLFKAEQKKKFPKTKLFQQGVNIRAIYEDLKKNPIHADIFQDIFIEQNPSMNTGPSAINQSENYIDGNQDCHGRVSTSTQPTSDEGTHHITSPEETNENVSTCTHPTTMERQGSQMVVSGQ